MTDFSKCQCPQSGWCKLFNKEMTATPPNWQWCQSLTPTERESYYKKSTKVLRTIKKATEAGQSSIQNFYDELSEQTSKIAICTIPADDYSMAHLNVTRDSMKKYAERCGADFIELTGDQHPEWPMSNKYRLHQVTSKYDKTLYLDCDVFVSDKAPNIFEVTPDDKVSAYDEQEIFNMPGSNSTGWIQKEQDVIIRKVLSEKDRRRFLRNGRIVLPNTMINGGVLVIPKSCADYYKQPDQPYPRYWCFDQHLLSLLLHKDDKFHSLGSEWNFELIRQDFWENIEDAYFIHFNAARPNTYRSALIRRIAAGNYLRYDFGIDKVKSSAVQWLREESKFYFHKWKDIDDKPPVADVNKNLVVTVGCGEKYEEILDITGPTIAKYARRIGADYLEIRGKTQDVGYLEKFRIKPFVEKYNRTVFIDSDIIVTDQAPDIFKLVPEDQVGASCDYTHNYKNGRQDGQYALEKWFKDRRNTAESLLGKDVEKYLEISEGKMINSGVVVCSKQHADIWEPIKEPFIKSPLAEQFLVEARILLNHNWFKLEDAWNMQPWFPNDLFFKLCVKKYFIHFAGWERTNYWHDEIGYTYARIPRKEMIQRCINEKDFISS